MKKEAGILGILLFLVSSHPLLAGDKSGAMDFFDTCTRFEIHGFVEDELAHIKLKELAEKSGE